MEKSKLLKPIFSTKEITVKIPLTKDGIKALRKNKETKVEVEDTKRIVTFCQGLIPHTFGFYIVTGISIMNPVDNYDEQKAKKIAFGRAEKNYINHTEVYVKNIPPKIIREELLLWSEKYVENNLIDFILYSR